MFKVLNRVNGLRKLNGSSSKAIINATYDQLENVLGIPSIEDPSPDNKVQKEWFVEFQGEYFSVYDWKTYDEIYTMEYLNKFHIGSKKGDAQHFVKHLEDQIKKVCK